MKHTRNIITALLAMLSISANAQGVKMSDVFKAMPDSLLPSLTTNNRLDLIDFVASNMEAVVKNKFGEEVKLTTLTDDYMRLELSTVSAIELRTLPSTTTLPDSSNTVVCMVQTFGGDDDGESCVTLFTSKWHALQKENIVDGMKRNLVAERPDTMAAETYDALLPLLSNMTAIAQLSPTATTLTLRPTLLLLSTEEKAKAKAILRPMTLVWDGKSYKKS